MAEAPPPILQPAPPAKPGDNMIVLSRDDHNEIVTTNDHPLVLIKAGRTEQALVRHALFIASSVQVVRPVNAPAAATDSYRWSYEGFLQRQLCFTSMTGQFSCTTPELIALPDKEQGEAPVLPVVGGADDDPFPGATAAEEKITKGLKSRAASLFETDRKTKVEPLFKAAGVTAAAPGAAAVAPKR